MYDINVNVLTKCGIGVGPIISFECLNEGEVAGASGGGIWVVLSNEAGSSS